MACASCNTEGPTADPDYVAPGYEAEAEAVKALFTVEAYGGIESGLEDDTLTTAFEIPAGLSDGELAQAFIDRSDAWTMDGVGVPRSPGGRGTSRQARRRFTVPRRTFAGTRGPSGSAHATSSP